METGRQPDGIQQTGWRVGAQDPHCPHGADVFICEGSSFIWQISLALGYYYMLFSASL